MDPKNMSQDQRQALWEQAGHPGIAPAGYGGEGGSGGGTFNFDYAKAATDAYGELGTYYDRLLKESKGDLDLALSRLVEDYDKGVRIRTEDTKTANAADVTANKDSALSRGLYQKSLFAPFNPNAAPTEGMGVADTANPNNPYGERISQNNLQLDRNNQTAATDLSRKQVDLPEQQRRNTFNLEQQRRTEAAGMAETQGNRELQKWQSSQVTLA